MRAALGKFVDAGWVQGGTCTCSSLQPFSYLFKNLQPSRAFAQPCETVSDVVHRGHSILSVVAKQTRPFSHKVLPCTACTFLYRLYRFMDDPGDAVTLLMEDAVLPNVPHEALVEPNNFRRDRLYTREVNEVLSSHMPFLQVRCFSAVSRRFLGGFFVQTV